METVIYIIVGIIIGVLIGWLLAKSTTNSTIQSEKDSAQQKINDLELDFVEYKATSAMQIQTVQGSLNEKTTELGTLKIVIEEKVMASSTTSALLSAETAKLQSANENFESKQKELATLKESELKNIAELSRLNSAVSTLSANFESKNESLMKSQNDIVATKEKLQEKETELSTVTNKLSTASATLEALNQTNIDKSSDIVALKLELKNIKLELTESNQMLATQKANNEALNEKLDTQKQEIIKLGEKFNLEFENIANKILDTKSEKFTELNKTNLRSILDPLGLNIEKFKTKVEEVYQAESKERFSLGEKVKELAELNKIISDEAKNLTNALKGESKTQGRWGEMILESILEKSGLVKDREYFMEHQLVDENGVPLKSASEDKKMRPDAVIKYPDNRSVIIDSKVSLNAFLRHVDSTDKEEQNKELQSHVGAIRTHIVSLSSKGYDDYDKALDFVMMFIPSEPAYIAALQGDSNLWNFAYEKRILLISPTNLITSIKLISDLWKREYQNQNAQEIADRGAKLYDKFVNFVTNLEAVGDSIQKADLKYKEAFKQLYTGNDNLVVQATKLKNLGVKNKKDLSKDIESAAEASASLLN
jgi:DNA recombination protein RmuC